MNSVNKDEESSTTGGYSPTVRWSPPTLPSAPAPVATTRNRSFSGGIVTALANPHQHQQREATFHNSQESLPLSTLGTSLTYRPLQASSSKLGLRSLDEIETDSRSVLQSTFGGASGSRVNLIETQEQVPLMSEKREGPSKESTMDEDREKPRVHYPENIKPFQYGARRESSGDFLSSRPSSIAGTDDEDSENYDWSGEEDLADEEAKFEKKMGVKTKPTGWGIKRIIGLLFSTLLGSMFLASVLVTPAVLIQFYWYRPHPTDYRRYVKDNVQSWLFWAAANLVISWWLALAIDMVPVVTRFIIAAAWGHVSEYIKSRIEMYNSVKDTIKPVFYAASGWVSWVIIFTGIYDLYNPDDPQQSRAKYLFRVSQVVEFMFFLALVYSVSQMLSHAIAFNFHRTAYKERIESLEEALAVIEKLRDYRPPPRTGYTKSGSRTPVFWQGNFSDNEHAKRLSTALRDVTPPPSKDGHGDDDGADGDTSDVDNDATLVSRKGKKNRWSWFREKSSSSEDRSTMHADSPLQSRKDTSGTDEMDSRQPIPPVTSSRPLTPSNLNPHRYPPQPNADHELSVKQAAKAIKNAVLHDARNLRGTNEEDLANLTWNVSSTEEAKRLARSIYMRFKARNRNYLIPADFIPVFHTEEASKEAFSVFDKDNNGDISRGEIKRTLVKVYKERRFLSRSMRDVGEALKTLHRIILALAGVILFFISLSVFGVEVGNSLTSVYSLGIALSFIFKASASSAFDAIMFLFVTHPYDTGDRCFIDNENLVVKKVGLFATVFSRSDGTETYYFNSMLFNKFITNCRRSGKTFENLTMQVAWRTPLVKLDALEKCLNDWLSTEENRWFEPSTNVTPQHIVYQRYLELTIGIGYNGNWQDWGLRNARRTAFHAAVQYYCNQLGIVGYEAPLPIVHADPKTKTYSPPDLKFPPDEDEDRDQSEKEPEKGGDLSASTPLERARQEAELQEIETAAKNMKPSLGFLPPKSNREATLTRARKSKSRKTVLRGMND